jgi:hypothetical protein
MAQRQFRIGVDVGDILTRAPVAVNSYHPGHWDLLSRLEKEAQDVLSSRSVEAAISFLTDIAFLKQPYQFDHFRKARLRSRLSEHSTYIIAAIEALSEIRTQDYAAMIVLAKVPYFGINGGRAYNSAVMRLVCPERFAIIDWRNLAVLAGAYGFEGLVDPPVVFSCFDKATIIKEKGHLLCTQDVYEQYNNIIRELAGCCGLRAADVDLILWTYSIDRKPFLGYQEQASMFQQMFSKLLRLDSKARLREKNLNERITNLTKSYISALKDIGWLPPEKIRNELRALFSVIRDECEAYGRNKPWLGLKIKKITRALDVGIKARTGERLLAHWRRWENMLDPASSNYIRIGLPGSMIMEGYLVFEQLIPIREYFEQKYRDSSFEPAEPSECVLIA